METSRGAGPWKWRQPLAPDALPRQGSWQPLTGRDATSPVENQQQPGRNGWGEFRERLVIPLSFLLPFLALVVFWSKQIRTQFSPLGDQFSLFVNSTWMFHPHASSWFLDGFSHYFHPYPGWPGTGTDFLRPGANAAYYLGSLLFGRHWSWYLLSNYLFQSAIVALAVLIARRHLKCSTTASLGIGLLCFLSPAFGSSELFSSAFAFDLMASALVLAGIHELLSHRRLAAGLLFAIAIFTKETAFFAPFAAAVVLFLEVPGHGSRRFLRPLLLLLPYAAWVGIRLAAFRATVGVYAVPQQLSGTLIATLEDLARWPFPLGGTGGPHHGLPDWLFYGTVSLNLGFWLTLITWLVLAISRRSTQPRQEGRSHLPKTAGAGIQRAPGAALTVVIFCVLSSAILLLIPHLSSRFGATFLPLFYLCLALAASKATPRGFRIAAWCFLVLPLALSLSARSLLFPGELERAQLRWAFAKDYVHRIATSTAPVILTADDVSGGYSSNASIARFTGYRGRLVRINDLVWGPGCHFVPEITARTTADMGIELNSRIGTRCAIHAFLGSSAPWDRSGSLTRALPESKTRIVYRMPPADGLSALTVSITGIPNGALILVPDFPTKKYRMVQVGATAGAGNGQIAGGQKLP